jgi:myo-inositol 2-dehydrogenase/D-chiro-inositol 1-dehydrogenase
MTLFRFPYRPGSAAWRHDARRIGSWIMEELVHHFDLVLWYFAGCGDPVSLVAAGSGRTPDTAMVDNFACLVRFAGGRHAVVTFTLVAFEYHLTVEVAGTAGAARGWWSGTLDRTHQAAYELKVQRRGAPGPEVVSIATSGELAELEEQLRLAVPAFRERRSLVGASDARRAVALCLAAETSLREGREISLVL